MRTPAQIEASRINGAKSRGPVTPEGKLRSGQRTDRVVHNIALQIEDSGEFRLLLNDLLLQHQPVGITERLLVDKMAIVIWKQQRYLTVEKVATDLQVTAELTHPPAYEHDGAAAFGKAVDTLVTDRRVLHTVNQLDARLDRQFFRALNMLLKLQDRRAAQPNPPAPVPFESTSPVADPQLGTQPDEPLDADATPEAGSSTEPDEPLPIAAIASVCFLNLQNLDQPTHHSLKTNDHSRVASTEPSPSSVEQAMAA